MPRRRARFGEIEPSAGDAARIRAARMQVPVRERRRGDVQRAHAMAETLRACAERAFEIHSGAGIFGRGLHRERARNPGVRVPRARERSDKHQRREERGAESPESLQEPHRDEENRRGRRRQSAAGP